MKEIQFPAIMGIWNVSPDSFSSHIDTDARSIEHARRLCREGADILDIGAESTRPGSDPVSVQLEIERLTKPLEWARETLSCPISLDSRHAETIEWAAGHGYIDIINDVAESEVVSDDREGRIYAAARDTGIGLIVMAYNDHSSPELPFGECMKKIIDQLSSRIEFAMKVGVKPSQIIVDPGIGFGKGLTNDLRLIADAPAALKRLGFPVLIAHSRKRCIAKAAGADADLDAATAIASAVAFEHGADMVRVHHPALSVTAKRLMSCLLASKAP